MSTQSEDITQMWWAMFGNNINARAGVFIADYKKFFELIQARDAIRDVETELRIWRGIESCVENSSDNTERLLRFHLPPFDRLIEGLEAQLAKLKEEL